MGNSRRITELDTKTTPSADDFFVMANGTTNTNTKIGYDTLKNNISNSIGRMSIYTQWTPGTDASNDQALGAYLGWQIYNFANGMIPLSSDTPQKVSTNINFSGKITSPTPNDKAGPKEVVNVKYFNDHINKSLFDDFELEYIYGNEIMTKIGGPVEFDKTNPAEWVAVDVIAEKNRTNETGWQSMKKPIVLKKSISNFKKIILLVSDESGCKYDSNTQIFPFEIDVSKYKFFMQMYDERKRIFDDIKDASKGNPVTLKVCGQQIKWTSKYNGGGSINADDCVYFDTNMYNVRNTSIQERHLILKYNSSYYTTIEAYNSSYYMVAVIGLK